MKRLLIVGCGDIARRALPALLARYEVHAMVRSGGSELQALGVRVLHGDLDRPESLHRLADIADDILHLAPPAAVGEGDARTGHLIAALNMQAMVPRRLVYISTSGVYGDCKGEWVDESRPLNPQTSRAKRRVDAERRLRDSGMDVVLLRVPGIYAADRLPLERLQRGTPVLRVSEDVYTNHIHAEDLAAILVAALERAPAGAVYNVSDDSEIKMGDWFDLIADRVGLARPPRIAAQDASASIPPTLLSFMRESRRLSNRRMKAELGYCLRYPTVFEGVPMSLQIGDRLS